MRIGTLFLSFLFAALCSHAAEEQSLEVATVESRTVPREFRLDGLVEAVNRATVSAQVSGQVESIHFDVHEQVEAGDLLVKLRDTEYRAGLTRAMASLQSAEALLKQRKEQFARIKDLFERNLSSATSMDQATADLDSAQANYDAAAGALEQAREQLAYTEIRAPYPGLVTERHIEEGEIANPGKPVMSGISLDHLRVMIDVPQSVTPALRESGKVRVTLPDDRVLEIDDIRIYPIADSGSSSFRVRVNLPRGTKPLFPGMFVKVSLIVGEDQVLAVPESAIVKRSEVTGVYIVVHAEGDGSHRIRENGTIRIDQDGGAVRFRQIRAGRDLGDYVSVLSGLTEGEQVATNPSEAVIAIKRQRTVQADG
jgi:RND family efflux transporter MFP subunit